MDVWSTIIGILWIAFCASLGPLAAREHIRWEESRAKRKRDLRAHYSDSGQEK